MLALMLIACSCHDGSPISEPDEGAVPGDVAPLEFAASGTVNDGHFATGQICAECHSNADGADAMRTSDGEAIGQYDLWQATMMANAGRDPLFWAVVSSEIAAAPHLESAIVAKCSTCHTPMAIADAGIHGEPALDFETLRLGESERAQLGRDGVSCTVCHQITDQGLGEWSSFSGGWEIKADGSMYGPHSEPFTNPMEMHTGFTPTQGEHVMESSLCATCHTLETNALTPDGEFSGVLIMEQAPYLEWKNSSYPDADISCQSCHVKTVDSSGDVITTDIARRPSGSDFPPIDARSPYGQHMFVGGNAFMLELIRDNADLLNPGGSTEAFDATIAATRTQLSESTAALTITEASRSGGQMELAIQLRADTGHKFPSGHPSRRAWVVVEVWDDAGALVFRSGGWDEAGRLVDMDGALLETEGRGAAIQPHHDTITDDSQVQIYQAVMEDLEGGVTYRLLAGAGYAKDNRLLPAGWDTEGPDIDAIAAVGVDGDPDFGAGGDTVRYDVEAPEGPLTVSASLVYQSVGSRYVTEFSAYDTPEVSAFLTLYEAASRVPETIAVAELVVD